MNQHDHKQRPSPPWQAYFPIACLLGSVFEYFCLSQPGPLHVTLPHPYDHESAFLFISGTSFFLPTLPLFFFKAEERPRLLSVAAGVATIQGTGSLVRLYFQSFFVYGYGGALALWVVFPTLFLRLLLLIDLIPRRARGSSEELETFSTSRYSAPSSLGDNPGRISNEGPGAFSTVETNAPSSYTLDRVVCSVCSTRYSRSAGTHCPSCTAPLELAVPLHGRPSSWARWRLWQGPSSGQRQAASGLLLLDALFLATHVLLLRDVSPWFIALLGVDAVLAVLVVWKPVGVWLVLARAVMGLLVAWRCFTPDTLPFLLLTQEVLGVSLGVLLVHRLAGWTRLLAVPGPVLYAVLVGVMVSALATANSFLTLGVLQRTGMLHPEPVSLARGHGERYTLRLPPGPWYAYTQAQAEKMYADLVLFSPEREVEVAVGVQPIPDMADPLSLERLETATHQELERLRPGVTWGRSRELPGSWDEARVAPLRIRVGGIMREGLMATYRRDHRLFTVMLSAPAWRYHDPGPLLEEFTQALSYEPPPPVFLPEEIAGRVKQATVGVRTPRGRGSGFIVKTPDGSFILTARHLLRATNGEQELREVFVVLPGDTSVERRATVRASDPQLDLALLELPPDVPRLSALSLRAAPVTQDTRVVASALPWGEPILPEALQAWPTLRLGTVKNPHARPPSHYPDRTASLIQMEPHLEAVGGPVVDLDGAVVGLAVGDATPEGASVLVPSPLLKSFVESLGVRGVEGAPAPIFGTDPFPTPAREALSAATVIVSAGQGSTPRLGVVVGVPGFARGLVLTTARGANAGDTVEVRFFMPASRSWKTQRGKVWTTRSYQKNTLALIEVDAFPELPHGLPLQEPSHLSETDLVALGGLREVDGTPWPLQRPGVLAGIDRVVRWEHGPQSLTRFRVDAGRSNGLVAGPAMDQQGALAGFVLQRSETTNLFELVAAEQLQELLQGPVRAVAARASRDLKGDCLVEFLVDARQPLSGTRTASFAVTVPDLAREGDSLAPVFGPGTQLGVLPETGGILRQRLASCSGSRLVYRLELTSAFGARRVEGQLPLPARALERTQARAPLSSPDSPGPRLQDFMEWKGEPPAPAPTTPREALTVCASSPSACGFVMALGAAAPARERASLLQSLQASCRQGEALACLGWAEVADLAAPPLPPGKEGVLTPALPDMQLSRECSEGQGGACSRMGRYYLEPGRRLDLRSAARLLREGCQGGVIEDCSGLGGVLAEGQGVPPVQKALLPEVRTALGMGCDAGLAEACSRLGRRLMRHGAREPQPSAMLEDWKAAAELLRKGCEAGQAEGCVDLAGALAAGHGVERDEALALRRYRQACRLHDAMACLYLGYLDQESKPPPDRNRAYEAFREACGLGLAQGCNEMPRAMDWGL